MNLELLNQNAYETKQEEKEKLFLGAMKKEIAWHFKNCLEFRKFCQNRGFDPKQDFKLEDIPYLPISTFKNLTLQSVPGDQIIRTLYSSSTSGSPSKILIDQETSDRQTAALYKILPEFLGRERRHFVIFDTAKTAQSVGGELQSRGTAIRGMLSMAKGFSFVLNEALEIDLAKLDEAIAKLKEGDRVCFFGFTWLIYNTCVNNKDNKKIIEALGKIDSADKVVLHIGGWKKLKDIAVSKIDFNKFLSKTLSVKEGNIIDVYGMTEQLGTVYPDCTEGHKHTPLYSEVIIRDINTLKSAPSGEIGFMQFISPLPHSYPGISLLSDDLGKIIGVDDCPCGKKGKYFVFEKRSEKAELRGCGDTLKT